MSDTERLPRLAPADMDEDQRALYNAIAGGRRAQGPQLFRLRDDRGALEGPFNAFLLQPLLGGALQELGACIRYQTSLTDRSRELAILVVALHMDSAFEWYTHEAVGRHVGLLDKDVEAIRARRYDDLTDEVERIVAMTADRLSYGGDLDDDAYAEALVLGQRQLFELSTLVGYYRTLALQLRIFRVASPQAGLP